MSNALVADGRWSGQHGIGRFAAEVLPRLQGVDSFEGPCRPASLKDPMAIARYMRGRRQGLFYSPGFNAGFIGEYRQAVTVHDLIHLEVPEERSFAKRAYYASIVRPALLQGRLAFTVSEFSRARVIAWSGLAPDEVVNVGVGLSIPRATSDELVARSSSGATGMVLFVGNDKPHKNLQLAMRALSHLEPDLVLTTVGVSRSYVTRLALDCKLDPRRVRTCDGISDDELRDLYLKADCLAMPSTYEGFGLPPLEAMAVGTPTAYVADAVYESTAGTGFRARNEPEAYAQAIDRAMHAAPSIRRELIDRSRAFEWRGVASKVARAIGAAA